METKKIPMNGYDAILYKTKKYSKLISSFMFQLDYTKENIYLCDILVDYMLRTNKKYKTQKQIQEMIRTYYDANIEISDYHIGPKMFVEFSFTLLDPKLVQDDYLIDAINFASEMFLHPNFQDGKLDKEILEEIKTRRINAKEKSLNSPGTKENIAYKKFIGQGTYLTTDLIETKKEYEDLLNSFTDKDFIDMHKKIINECFIGCHLIGNYTDKILDEIKKKFVFGKPREIDANYLDLVPFNLKQKYQEIGDPEIGESALTVAYSIKDYTPDDRYKYCAIEMALGSVGKIMHRVLRKDMELVYSAWPYFNTRGGYLELTANINKENKDKTLEGFKIALNKLKDREYVEELLKLGKKEVELSNYVEDENEARVFNRLINETYKIREPKDVVTQKYMDLTVDDIIESIDRLNEEATLFYRGDK